MNDKELLFNFKFPNKIWLILFGYDINFFSNHNNLIYVDIPSKSKMGMQCILILKEFASNIQNVSSVKIY